MLFFSWLLFLLTRSICSEAFIGAWRQNLINLIYKVGMSRDAYAYLRKIVFYLNFMNEWSPKLYIVSIHHSINFSNILSCENTIANGILTVITQRSNCLIQRFFWDQRDGKIVMSKKVSEILTHLHHGVYYVTLSQFYCGCASGIPIYTV